MAIQIYNGPGLREAGMAGEFIQEDSQGSAASSTTYSLKMVNGSRSGETVCAQVIQMGIVYTSAAPGVVAFTDAELASFKAALITSISGSSKLDNIVTSSPTMTAGDIDQLCRVCLRTAAGGTLDNAGGSYTVGASGVLLLEVIIPHANPVTGLNHAPDVSLLTSTWSITTGAASPALAGTTITITNRNIITGNVVIRNRPGSLTSHIGLKSVVANQSNDQLDSQERLGHLVVGSGVSVYNTALTDYNNGGAFDFRNLNFSVFYGGKNPFNSQGYLNRPFVWDAFLGKATNGSVPCPGIDRGASGPQSYTMLPLLAWDGRSVNSGVTGEVVINNAANIAATRYHNTIEVRRGGAR